MAYLLAKLAAFNTCVILATDTPKEAVMKVFFSVLFVLGIGWTFLFLSIPFLFNPSGITSMVLASGLGMSWMIQHAWFHRGNPRVAVLVLCSASLLYVTARTPTVSWSYLSSFLCYVIVYGGIASFGAMFSWFCWRDPLSSRRKNVRTRVG